MKKFTVILLRPDYLASDDAGGFGQDVYVAFVEAGSAQGAVELAQHEVFDLDTIDSLCPEDPNDYALVLVQPGHVKPGLWGWQL